MKRQFRGKKTVINIQLTLKFMWSFASDPKVSTQNLSLYMVPQEMRATISPQKITGHKLSPLKKSQGEVSNFSENTGQQLFNLEKYNRAGNFLT